MVSPDEKTYRDLMIEQEASPAELALADFLAAFYGLRESESAYHAIRSVGQPKSIVDATLLGPLLVLAAARWHLPDEAFEDRVAAIVDRTGHARGRALLTHAEAIRAYTRANIRSRRSCCFDAGGVRNLKLEYERAVALAISSARSETVPGPEARRGTVR